MIYFNENGRILESDYNNDPTRVLAHCAQQKYGEENNWKTPDGKNFAVTSIGLFAMNETHYIDNNLCTWIERPPGLNNMLSGDELKFYKQKLVTNQHEVIELFNNTPEVKAFHMQYQDAQTSLRDDHISYFSGSDDGYLVRMNLYFDENFSVDNIDFHCYYQKVHQFELPQDDLTSKIEKYDCKEHAFEAVSSIPSAKEFLQMDCEDLNRHYPEFPSEEVADAWITRMHECLNEQENEN